MTILLLLLAIAFFLQVDFIFYIVYVGMGIYAWSRWMTPRIFSQVQVERVFNKNAFLGERVAVEMQIKNNGRFPLPWLELYESIPPQLLMGKPFSHALSLKGHQIVSYTYPVHASRRGYYQLGPLRMMTGDLFGLSSKRQGAIPASYLTVFPKIIPLARLGLPSRLPFGTLASTQRLFADPSRPAGVRNYRSGDSLRQINWKVSARQRDLVVKTYQPAISLETAVLLNLHTDDYSRHDRQTVTEWAVVVAASLTAHLIDKRQPVGLISNGTDPLQMAGANAQFDKNSGRLLQKKDDGLARIALPILPRNGRFHLMKILEQLARIESSTTIPFPRWAATACINLSWGMTLLAVTPRGDEATCQTLHRLAKAGYNPILITVESDYNFGLVRERARRLGFRAFQVSKMDDLTQWQQR